MPQVRQAALGVLGRVGGPRAIDLLLAAFLDSDLQVEEPPLEDVIRAAPWAGRYMCGIGVIAAVIQGGLIRRLVLRFGEPALAVVGPALLALSFVIVGLASSWWIVILGCLVMPCGFGINNPALNGLISRATPQEEQGAFLGLNQSIASLARVVGPAAAGVAFELIGSRSPFFLGAGILAVSATVALVYRARHGASFPRSAPVGAIEA